MALPLDSTDLAAIWLTIELASLTTLLLLLIGTPIAWRLARTRSWLKGPIGAVVALPLVLPPTVIGFYLLVSMGPNGFIGQLTQSLGLGTLPFTFAGLVVGSVFYSLPFVVQPLQNAFEAIGEKPLEAAATLRASPVDRFFSVVLPLARLGFVTAAILGFAHTVGEFGVVLMIGGNIPEKTRVVSVQIFDHVEAMEYAQAHWLAGGMVAFSFVVLLALLFGPAPPAGLGLRWTACACASAAPTPASELDIDLALPGRGVTALFGYSGSGKSTCLRCIAGLEKAAEGEVTINGETWQDSRRNLFVAPPPACPRLRVPGCQPVPPPDGAAQPGLRSQAHRRRRTPRRAGTGLRPAGHRAPAGTHAGTPLRRRAATRRHRPGPPHQPAPAADGRASGILDLKRKGEILPYLERLHEELDIPVLYVSHSPDEVARLADHLVLLENGKVRASGPIGETLARVDPPLALDDDAGVVIEGTVSDHDPAYGLLTLVLPGSALQMRVAHAPLAPGKRLRFKRTGARRQPEPARRRPEQHPQPPAGTGPGIGRYRHRGPRTGAPGCRRQSAAGADHPLLAGPVATTTRPAVVGADQVGGGARLTPASPAAPRPWANGSGSAGPSAAGRRSRCRSAASAATTAAAWRRPAGHSR